MQLAVQLRNGIVGLIRLLLSPRLLGAGAGTPISIEVTIPVDACPEIELSGLIPNTEYEVTVRAQSGVATSDPVVTTFTTRECLLD